MKKCFKALFALFLVLHAGFPSRSLSLSEVLATGEQTVAYEGTFPMFEHCWKHLG